MQLQSPKLSSLLSLQPLLSEFTPGILLSKYLRVLFLISKKLSCSLTHQGHSCKQFLLIKICSPPQSYPIQLPCLISFPVPPTFAGPCQLKCPFFQEAFLALPRLFDAPPPLVRPLLQPLFITLYCSCFFNCQSVSVQFKLSRRVKPHFLEGLPIHIIHAINYC